METTPNPSGAPWHRFRGDQGTALKISITYCDPAGQPVNLTDATATATIREPGTGTQLAAQTVDGTADGVLTFVFPAATTTALPPGRSAITFDLAHLDADPDRILVGALDLREPHRV